MAERSLPDDPTRGRRGNVWVRATRQTEYYLVRTRVTWFLGHWSAKHRCSIRCGGDICAICASGTEARPFLYVGVWSESKIPLILELNRRHRSLAEQLNEEPGGGVGCQLAIRKDGLAKNSPVVIVITGLEECVEESVEAFVATLGRAAALVPASVPDVALPDRKRPAKRSSSRTGAM